jgi:hypothetical protein
MLMVNELVKVRCLECKFPSDIKINRIGNERIQRSLGFEYEHYYNGSLKCNCGELMRLSIIIWEYPKNEISHHEIREESCLIVDKLIL